MSGHGYTAYSQGCRCDTCRAAGKAYRDSRRGQSLPAYISHGTISAYQSWGCRCEACVDTRRSYDRARRAS